MDHESGLPLAGVAVGLAPWIAGATPVPQPASGTDGTFVVTAQNAGKYLLVIGADLSNDPANRPTIHDAITLTSSTSTQVLIAPTMPPVPSTTPDPIEQSGTFRLTTLDANEQACLAYENQKRASLGYAPVIPDEWLTENQRMIVQREASTGTVGGGVLTPYNGMAGGGCTDMIDNDYTVRSNMGTPLLNWYAGDEVSLGQGAVDEGMPDPRGALPSPQPREPWP